MKKYTYSSKDFYMTDLKEEAYMMGKATELAILLGKNNKRGVHRFFFFIKAIEIFKQFEKITPSLAELVTMKNSEYREQLIESEIWTREILEEIMAKVSIKIEVTA